MKPKRWWLILAVVLLMTVSLSCGILGGSESPSGNDTTSPQGAGDSQPSAPQANLGDVYRSEVGGYAFQAIPGYEVEEVFGLASMLAPGADPDEGPVFLFVGGASDEPLITEEIIGEMMENSEDDTVTLEQREITVGGKQGILMDVEGEDDSGTTSRVRVVIVSVSDTQHLTIMVLAPIDRWGEVDANFDSVLASISFFEPQEISPDDLAVVNDVLEGMSEEFSETNPDDSGEYDLSDLEALSDFPSQTGDLPPGGFIVVLSDEQGTLVLVEGEQAQPQPAGDEYVVVLPGKQPENTITLFLPHDAAADMLMMVPYDASAAAHAPGATIQLGSALYTSTDGIIMVEAMDGNTISGSMFFVAVDESGAELSVSGFFNALPLTP